MASVIDMAGVGVVRGDKYLLRNIDWSVDEKDRWVVIGPNGAGKSTLMQLASANLHPSEGVVGILGEVMGAVDVFELRPRIGVSSALMGLRVPENELAADAVVSAAYAIVGRWREEYGAPDHQRAQGLMDRLGVGQLAQRRFGTLSEGERKRVLLARALMADPELLIMDEPGAGLDLAGRELLVNSLADLAANQYAPATVLVTHHVEEIPPGMTHALLLRDGEIVSQGEIGSVMTDHNLSTAFDLPLRLRSIAGRWYARAQ